VHRLGQLLGTKGDYLAATRLFKTLAGLKPELFKPLAQCYEALGRDFDAANAYREVIRIRPDRPEAFAGMARLLIRMGRIADVNAALLNALSGALSLQNSPSHYFGKGRSRMQ
jgi:Flp pilus assembly protein TadD